MAGEVRVAGAVATKAGMAVPTDVDIVVTGALPYVSRGGFKLAAALDVFELDVADKVCADVGACTGGFTDVLLQRGATRVYAIDVGYGQLAWKLRQDTRVVVLERTNARHLEALAEPVGLAVVDVSFISLKLILPAVERWLTPDGYVVVLIKPQFEAGRDQVGKGGVVRDSAVHRSVLLDMLGWAEAAGWRVRGLATSPVKGSDGNIEFLAWLGRGEHEARDWSAQVDDVLAATQAPNADGA
jgi:23S rRNA (cytidine1920-2'-O)/16S rRNA (cytidine1409-2'-O)-methyltransferase